MFMSMFMFITVMVSNTYSIITFLLSIESKALEIVSGFGRVDGVHRHQNSHM